jgi:hypothetical protein
MTNTFIFYFRAYFYHKSYHHFINAFEVNFSFKKLNQNEILFGNIIISRDNRL